jgi:hypothetical protein
MAGLPVSRLDACDLGRDQPSFDLLRVRRLSSAGHNITAGGWGSSATKPARATTGATPARTIIGAIMDPIKRNRLAGTTRVVAAPQVFGQKA